MSVRAKFRPTWSGFITLLVVVALITIRLMSFISTWMTIIIFLAFAAIRILIESRDPVAQAEADAFTKQFMQQRRSRRIAKSVRNAFEVTKRN